MNSESDDMSKMDTEKKDSESSASLSSPPEENSVATDSNASETTIPHKKSSSGVSLLTLALILVISMSVASGYWGYTQFTLLNSRLTNQQQQISHLESSIQKQLPQVETLIQQQSDTSRTELNEVRQYLAETARRMTETQGITRYEWLLAEAEYLMRLAQQRLQLERDAQGALAILQSADAVLRDAADANLIPVREQLAKDMAALAQVQQLDREGIYLKLNVMIEQLNQWFPALALTSLGTESAGESGEHPEADNSWTNRFSQYFSIEKIDALTSQPIEQHMVPLYRAIIQHALSQAQTALLKNHTQAFAASIDRASNWLETFGSNNGLARNILAQLDEISQSELMTELPPIGSSLSLLKGYIAEIYLLQRTAPEEQ